MQALSAGAALSASVDAFHWVLTREMRTAHVGGAWVGLLACTNAFAPPRRPKLRLHSSLRAEEPSREPEPGASRLAAALKPARSVASVSFALHVFRQHCQAFGIYTEQKGQPRLKRAALDTAIRCYYHPGAFGIEKKPGGKPGKKK